MIRSREPRDPKSNRVPTGALGVTSSDPFLGMGQTHALMVGLVGPWVLPTNESDSTHENGFSPRTHILLMSPTHGPIFYPRVGPTATLATEFK